MDIPVKPDGTSLSAEKLIALAAEWRVRAGETTNGYYVEMMLRTAEYLEQKARSLG